MAEAEDAAAGGAVTVEPSEVHTEGGAEAKKSAPAAAARKPAAKLPIKPPPPAQAGKSRFQVFLRVASMPDLWFRVYG
jgi:hypothetical protein